MECASEDEVVVYGEFGKTFSEVALIDQAARFIYYQESVDHPSKKYQLNSLEDGTKKNVHLRERCGEMRNIFVVSLCQFWRISKATGK
jgi:hypothetical protein